LFLSFAALLKSAAHEGELVKAVLQHRPVIAWLFAMKLGKTFLPKCGAFCGCGLWNVDSQE